MILSAWRETGGAAYFIQGALRDGPACSLVHPHICPPAAARRAPPPPPPAAPAKTKKAAKGKKGAKTPKWQQTAPPGKIAPPGKYNAGEDPEFAKQQGWAVKKP